jgi:drug/metabolite transporter (DMT)-like permease
MPPNLESSLSPWSARARWTLRGVGAVLGLIWGLLGTAVEALLVRNGTGPPLTENPALIAGVVGMVFGVGHASQFWLARVRQPARSWSLEVLLWAVVCIALGILWGSPMVLVFLQFTLSPGFPVMMFFLIPFFGALLSVYTVLPTAILMAPVTVFVWHKTLEYLESQRDSSRNS